MTRIRALSLGLILLFALVAGSACKCAPPPKIHQDVGDITRDPGPQAIGPLSLSSFDHLWSWSIGGVGDDQVTGVARLEDGGVIIGGHFSGELRWSGGNLKSKGDSDLFVALFSTEGEVRWLKQFGGDGRERLEALDVGEDGRIFLTGAFTGEWPGLGASAGARDLFLLALGSDGLVDWGRRVGGQKQDSGVSLAVGPSEVWVAGYFSGEVEIAEARYQAESLDPLLLSYDFSGHLKGQRVFSGPGVDKVHSIVLSDAGELLLVGDFRKRLSFGTQELEAKGGRDAFVALLDSKGTLRWARSFGGERSDSARAASTSGDQFFVGGFFTGQVDFGVGLVHAGDLRNGFVVALDSEGESRWSHGFTSAQAGEVRWLGADAEGVNIAGFFQGEVNLGGGIMTSDEVSGDLFVAQYDLDGGHQWSSWSGSKGHESLRDAAKLGSAEVVLVGAFDELAGFGEEQFESLGEEDGFVVVVSPKRGEADSEFSAVDVP